jgi:CxxC-x17-CxxC domain-containing protein
MYDAVCSECGNSCQIPFRPSNGRDVFCSRCFEKQDGSQTERPERRSFDRPNANRTENRESGHGPAHFKAQFEALNTKLDKILGLLEKSPAKVVPLESEIDEKEIEKIVEEIQEVIPEKKPRKARKVTTKKTDSSKK